MIEKLLIKNFATIQENELDFFEGFSVLTGETGAGKSIIIDALGLLLGNRGNESFIRNGEDNAVISGVFNHEGRQILISRTLTRNGRNSIKIDGELSTLKELSALGDTLVKISAQFDNQDLLNEKTQFQLLENYAAKKTESVLDKYHASFPEYSKLRKIILDDGKSENFSPERIELVKYQFAELENANLSENEISDLEAEEKELRKNEKAGRSLGEILALIGDEGISSDIQSANGLISDLEDSKLIELSKLAADSVADLNLEVQNRLNSLDFDEERFNLIETRLGVLRELERKYRVSGNELIGVREKLAEEINQFENHDQLVEENKVKFQAMRSELLELAEQLHEIRSQVAIELSQQVESNLKDLLLEHARFEIRVEKTKQLTENGFDEVQFYISTNPGQDLALLNQVASGGEISRVLLATTAVFSDVLPVSTLVFDEIDTGVSGRAASAIAEKMRKLAQKTQILSITHLPQVAASAQYQYEITKTVENNQTFSKARLLTQEERVNAVASLLSGSEITESSIQNAKELLK
ncbi:MAG: DNA repair protein RecN [Lactobacillaceae bacterium]|jgi:DNA repair protein RecN (Recombination protein N)|nr:DNA repair protein RecN [Lactobacillaceae bacterium]